MKLLPSLLSTAPSARRGLGHGRCVTAARIAAPERIWDPFAIHGLENRFLGSTFLASWGGNPERPACPRFSNPKGPSVRECRDAAEILMSQLGKEKGVHMPVSLGTAGLRGLLWALLQGGPLVVLRPRLRTLLSAGTGVRRPVGTGRDV